MHSFKLTPVAALLMVGAVGSVYAASGSMADRAVAAMKANPAAVAMSPADHFTTRDTIVDSNGTTHVRMDRTYNGMRVLGGDVVVHSDREGRMLNVSKTLPAALNLSTEAVYDEDSAIASAESLFVGERNQLSRSELIIDARGATPVLAHDVLVGGMLRDGTPSRMHFIIDAKSGMLIDKWDEVETTATAATGKGFFNGNVALTVDHDATTGKNLLRDPSRGNQRTYSLAHKTSGTGTLVQSGTAVFGNNLLSNAKTVAADAQYGTSVTWDYYKTVHGRNGIANDGVGAYNRVHYSSNYVNAFWDDSCFCMTYGDGNQNQGYYPLDSLDVAGHEMSHGVTSRTAKLVYSGESGGLNEATSDIMGTMVEFYANNAKDSGDYLIGEEIFVTNPNMTNALRFMFKPSLDGASPDCWASNIGTKDVHYSSGVANHFYYLLAEGAVVPAGFGAGTSANLTASSLVCDGNTNHVGIGRDKASKIWYRALTVYMTSSTKYAAARTATLNAAKDLYGLNSTEYNAVASSWTSVSVN